MRKQLTVLSTILFCLAAGVLSSFTASAQTDVGVLSVINPGSSLCGGANTVTVVVQNYGSTTITSATIGWSVNGTSQTGFSYTGSIAPGNSDTVDIGTFSFSGGTNNTVTAFTAGPNGGTDDDNSNDTLTVSSLLAALNGTYTVGGTTPDFTNLAGAITALTTYGVCGPVTFNIRAGVDTVKAILPEITGASAVNSITFQSENGDSSSVKITYPSEPNFIPNNYLIRLDGCDYITFRHLTFERSGFEPYARIFEFINNATNNTFTGCHLIGSTTTAVSNSLAAIFYSTSSAPTNDSNNVFSGNRIENGTLGIYMNGIASLNPENNAVVSNNLFINQYAKAIDMRNQGSLIISNNTITTNSTFGSYTGIDLDRSQRDQRIVKNRINGTVKIGLNMVDCSGYNGTPGIVANNFLQATDSVGVRVDNGEYQELSHNSINMAGSATSTAIWISGIGIGNRIVNNILANNEDGLAYRISNSATSGVESSDYNDLYTTGTTIGSFDGSTANSLAAWQNIADHDTNSVNADPRFLTTTDLHATALAIDNLGTPLANVSDDIDGDSRSATAPDMGADEFTGVTRDLAVTAILTPANGDCGSLSDTVTAIVSNLGGASETGFDLTLTSTAFGGSVNTTYNGTLAAGATDTIAFNYSVNTSAGGSFTFTVIVAGPVDDNNSNDTLTVSRNITAQPSAPTTTGDSICGAGAAAIAASGSGTINWYDAANGGNLVGTGSTLNLTNVIATTNYYASNTSGGCSSERTVASVTVLPVPAVSLGNDTSVIQGNNVIFNAGAGFTSYLWGNGATTQSITVGTDGCYSVVVTNSFGCTATDTACLVIVQPTDVGVSSVLAPQNGDCENATAPVTVQVTNFGSNPAVNIPVTVSITGFTSATLNGVIAGPVPAGDSATITLGTINTTGGGTLSISAFTNYGAETNPANDLLSGTANIVTVPALPTGNDASRCGEGPVVLTATATQTVYWYDAPSGGNLLFIGNTFSIPVVSQTTTYYAQTGNVCPSQSRQAIVATINALPVVNLGNDTSVTGSLLLDAGAGFSTYLWSTTATTQSITVSQTGAYSVLVTDINGCANSDTINIQISVGIDNTNLLAGIQLYPNPNRGRFVIEGNIESSEPLTIRVIDIRGTVAMQEVINSKGGRISESFDLSRYASGVYTVQLMSDSAVRQIRMVIE